MWQVAASGCNRHREQNNRCTLINRVQRFSVRVGDSTFWHQSSLTLLDIHSSLLEYYFRILNTERISPHLEYRAWIPLSDMHSSHLEYRANLPAFPPLHSLSVYNTDSCEWYKTQSANRDFPEEPQSPISSMAGRDFSKRRAKWHPVPPTIPSSFSIVSTGRSAATGGEGCRWNGTRDYGWGWDDVLCMASRALLDGVEEHFRQVEHPDPDSCGRKHTDSSLSSANTTR